MTETREPYQLGNPLALNVRIECSRDALVEATQAAYLAKLVQLKAEYDLATARAYAIVAGQVAGKNEAERQANERMMLVDEYRACYEAERDVTKTRLDLEIARIEQRTIELRLRCQSWEDAEDLLPI